MSLGERLRAGLVARLIFAAIDWLNRWFASRRSPPEPDEHSADLPLADRAESFTKGLPPKPVKRTAKRAPVPPESLSGGQ